MGKRKLFPEIMKLAHKDNTGSRQGRRNFKNLKDESFYYHLLMNLNKLV